MNKLYKTKLCEDWETFGTCIYGLKCKFAHGEKEIRQAYCKYGNNCHINNCKFKHINKTNKENYINLYNLENLEINKDKKDKDKILECYIKELQKHIDICKNNWNNVHDFLGPLLKKELVNIKILNDILQQNDIEDNSSL